MSLKSDLKNRFSTIFNNNYKSVGYSFFKTRKIKAFDKNKINSTTLFGRNIYFKDPIEYLHSLTEIFINEIYKINLSSNPLIIDCGANIGISALYFKKKFPDAMLIAFEPDKQNFEILRLNVKSFDLNKIQLHNEAIWIENTFLNFSGDSSMSSKIVSDNTSTNQKVKATRLYDMINQKVDFLKIDIEGAEYAVILDIEDKLSFVQNMFLEYHGLFSQNNELTGLINILTKNGFHYYIKEAAPVYKTPFYRVVNDPVYDVQLNIFCFKNIHNL